MAKWQNAVHKNAGNMPGTAEEEKREFSIWFMIRTICDSRFQSSMRKIYKIGKFNKSAE